jgi:hypothetical protein
MRLSKVGTNFTQFFRTGYPDAFPRPGFNVAAALLPQRVADTVQPSTAGGNSSS